MGRRLRPGKAHGVRPGTRSAGVVGHRPLALTPAAAWTALGVTGAARPPRDR
ncbi:MAG: hypothetical protein JXA74_11100 [Anaerolineae bacterium]|nr:hypothetical protein [Anaerolineae bacterium]